MARRRRSGGIGRQSRRIGGDRPNGTALAAYRTGMTHAASARTHVQLIATSALALLAAACTTLPRQETPAGVRTDSRMPVTSNDTPYSRCLKALSGLAGDNRPAIAVGEVADKTGKQSVTEHGYELSQGATEMVISAFYKTRKARLNERYDLRVANQELLLRRGKLVAEPLTEGAVHGSDFIVTGALTELNYNLVSQGAGVWVRGAGGGVKTAVVNVALDLRVISPRTLEVVYVTSLQKQIVGREVQANVFRFFDNTLVEIDAGKIRNEPLQLGVRSVAEMAVYQIMTDYLGLPASPQCRLAVDGAAALPPTSQEGIYR